MKVDCHGGERGAKELDEFLVLCLCDDVEDIQFLEIIVFLHK